MTDKPKKEEETFDWSELNRALNQDSKGNVYAEKISVQDKFLRKFNENPFVPIGCGLTALCLTVGMISMSRRNHRMSQLAMRGRIAAQGFTVFALIGGILYASSDS